MSTKENIAHHVKKLVGAKKKLQKTFANFIQSNEANTNALREAAYELARPCEPLLAHACEVIGGASGCLSWATGRLDTATVIIYRAVRALSVEQDADGLATVHDIQGVLRAHGLIATPPLDASSVRPKTDEGGGP